MLTIYLISAEQNYQYQYICLQLKIYCNCMYCLGLKILCTVIYNMQIHLYSLYENFASDI